MRWIKIIYDFFRLWISYGYMREAWQDANTINNKRFQREMSKLNDKIHIALNQQKELDPEIQEALNNFKPNYIPKKDRFKKIDNGD